MNDISNSTISKLYTEYSIKELHGNNNLELYLKMEKLDIQSVKTSKR